jgi:ribosomal protection tetracycline resistance protein
MHFLNLGILAHVDAGKTSLTERILFTTGVIDKMGRVDDGTTQTDSLALERQRGITIKSAVVSFIIDGVTVNLIDTPGHPDFIAEVERVLDVLDGAVLVISAVESVQPQTRVLMRALQRSRIPTLLFVNKIDRAGAHDERVLQGIAEKLTPAIIAMGAVGDSGTRGACFIPYGAGDAHFVARLVDVLADRDETLLAVYVQDEESISYCRLRNELAAQSRQALVHPVFYGSAITGAGVDALIAGIRELLPIATGAADSPVTGTVFKIERGPAGEKVAYIRMFSGTVSVRDRVVFGQANEGQVPPRDRPPAGQANEGRVAVRDRTPAGGAHEGRVTAIHVFDGGQSVPSRAVVAGQIGKLWGLGAIQVGDAIGTPRRGAIDTPRRGAARRHFALPTLETIIVPERNADRGALHAALVQLAEQDPLITLRMDAVHGELFVLLYGEVQKEVIQATLADEFGLAVTFRETTTICVERPLGSGAAVEKLGAASNPFVATVGLRIDPAPPQSGVSFRSEVVKAETIPLFIYKAVEAFEQAIEGTVRDTLRQGLYGWEVTDCVVTLTQSGYASPVSTARDFRLLTPLVLMSALKEAGTGVCEPLQRFHLEIPADTLGPILPILARLRAIPHTPEMQGASCTLEGEIPAARVHELQQQLPALTRGEGMLDYAFDHYEPVRSTIPTRPRSDHNPLNRKEYLLHVVRRV